MDDALLHNHSAAWHQLLPDMKVVQGPKKYTSAGNNASMYVYMEAVAGLQCHCNLDFFRIWL